MSPILLTVTTIWTVLVGKFPRDLKFSGSFHHSSCCSCLQKLDVSCKTPYPEYIIKTACLKSWKAQKIPVEAAKGNSVETWIKPNNIGENRRLRCFLSSQPGNLLQTPSNQPQKSWVHGWKSVGWLTHIFFAESGSNSILDYFFNFSDLISEFPETSTAPQSYSLDLIFGPQDANRSWANIRFSK